MRALREWLRRGTPLIWLSGGGLALSLVMISGLVGYIALQGFAFFWPRHLVQVQTPGGPVLGEISAREEARLQTSGETNPGDVAKVQFRVANRDLYGQDYRWVPLTELSDWQRPEDALLVERLEGGAFIGRLRELRREDQLLSQGEEALKAARAALPGAQETLRALNAREQAGAHEINRDLESLRLNQRNLQAKGLEVAFFEAEQRRLQARFEALQGQIEREREELCSLRVKLESVDGQTLEVPLANLVRIVPSNRLGWLGRTGIYLDRWWEFLTDDPRESNTEGGVWPAIFGTVMMVLLMSVMVVPLGVVAALFLREYARQGPLVRVLRVAVNNLAGVPSIVFGIFGLGFFVYTLGGSLDQLFFSDRLPAPTFGTGGILWASLTLALLTVPVVIVATEEALGSVPRSQREASLALGATKWQTTWKVVLPSALPGILTGLVLAMARGAGEVAPLMLTGVVKLAPSMPLDGTFPFLHLDRKFMHLGFHIYDVGFQSPNSEAAKPMVFATALLLLLVVLVLNLAALRLRMKLRARMGNGGF